MLFKFNEAGSFKKDSNTESALKFIWLKINISPRGIELTKSLFERFESNLKMGIIPTFFKNIKLNKALMNSENIKLATIRKILPLEKMISDDNSKDIRLPTEFAYVVRSYLSLT